MAGAAFMGFADKPAAGEFLALCGASINDRRSTRKTTRLGTIGFAAWHSQSHPKT
jgi:hypothetical protein